MEICSNKGYNIDSIQNWVLNHRILIGQFFLYYLASLTNTPPTPPHLSTIFFKGQIQIPSENQNLTRFYKSYPQPNTGHIFEVLSKVSKTSSPILYIVSYYHRLILYIINIQSATLWLLYTVCQRSCFISFFSWQAFLIARQNYTYTPAIYKL